MAAKQDMETGRHKQPDKGAEETSAPSDFLPELYKTSLVNRQGLSYHWCIHSFLGAIFHDLLCRR